jgi:hypothetical protein
VATFAPEPRRADRFFCNADRRRPRHDERLALEFVSIVFRQNFPVKLSVKIESTIDVEGWLTLTAVPAINRRAKS